MWGMATQCNVDTGGQEAEALPIQTAVPRNHHDRQLGTFSCGDSGAAGVDSWGFTLEGTLS